MRQHKLIVIGRVVKPFGIKGEVRIDPFTESPEVFKRSAVLIFGESQKKVLRVRLHKGDILATLEGINTPEQAKSLVGCLVRTDERNLPPKEEDEYYWHELIGMTVTTLDGRELGQIVAITPTGANDVIHVEGRYGEVLLPFIDEVVADLDTETRKMIVDPLEGLLPDD